MRRAMQWMAAGAGWALLAAVGSTQEWMLELPGAVGDEDSDHQTLFNLELHPSGELYGVGSRQTNGDPAQAFVLHLGLDAQDPEMRTYFPPVGTGVGFYDLALDGDDTLVACGRSDLDGLTFPWLTAVGRDSNDVHWECSPTTRRGTLHHIARVPDGYVACGGLIVEGSVFTAYVVKVDLAGDVVWQREIGRPGGPMRTNDVEPGPDGDVYVTGWAQGEAYFLQFDADGSLHRSVSFQGGPTLRGGHLAPAPDGGFFVVSMILDPVTSDRQPWVARIAPDGASVWQYRYRMLGGGIDEARATPDGGCLIAGTRGITDEARPSALRIDGNGEVVWCRYYDIAPDSLATYSATGVPLPDGGAVLGTKESGPGTDPLVLMRVGPTGGLATDCGAVDHEVQVLRQATAFGLANLPVVVTTPPESFETVTTTPALLAMESTLECGDPCAPPAPYCVHSSNSVGPGGAIGHLGSTSIAANDFALTATGLPPSTPGVFFFGTQPTELPFADGTLCVSAPTFRLGMVTSFVTGDAFLPLDLTNLPAAAPALAPGSRWFFQLWYRDPAGGPAGTNLTNGLDASFCQ